MVLYNCWGGSVEPTVDVFLVNWLKITEGRFNVVLDRLVAYVTVLWYSVCSETVHNRWKMLLHSYTVPSTNLTAYESRFFLEGGGTPLSSGNTANEVTFGDAIFRERKKSIVSSRTFPPKRSPHYPSPVWSAASRLQEPHKWILGLYN